MLVSRNEKDKKIDKDHTERKQCDSTFNLKDTHTAESTLKENSNAFEKYEYGRLGGCYINSALHMRFLKWN